jgi:hypothetical protein
VLALSLAVFTWSGTWTQRARSLPTSRSRRPLQVRLNVTSSVCVCVCVCVCHYACACVGLPADQAITPNLTLATETGTKLIDLWLGPDGSPDAPRLFAKLLSAKGEASIVTHHAGLRSW